jgi:hypothetical protein
VRNNVLFQTQNQGSFGVSSLLEIFLFMVFAMPAIVLPLFTFHELPETPWVALLYPIGFFPLGVLFVLKRLMTRYALRVYETGAAEIVFPFRTFRIASEDLSRIVLETAYVAAVSSNRTWIRFDRILTSLSPMAFSSEELQLFFEAIQKANPSLVIQTS